MPDGGEHAVDRVGGELFFNHFPGVFFVRNEVDALHQSVRHCEKIAESSAPGTLREAQVVEEILGVLLAGRVGDLASHDAIVPAK